MSHASLPPAQLQLPARTAPPRKQGLLIWTRANLFGDRLTTIATLMISALLLACVPSLIRWLILDATWVADPQACHQAGGACWGVVREKFRFIIFGRYPFEEHWRPLVGTCILLALIVMSCLRFFWKRWLLGVWMVGLACFFVLMRGGVAGLSVVDTDLWSGLPLTIFLSSMSLALAFPIAVLIALGRRSELPLVRSLCVIYVEAIRSVPLISVLFMASFMFPLLLPTGVSVDVLVRVVVGIALFAAAYMAEVIRGGLQAIPKGQIEAAASIGLSYWQTQRTVVLPQALTIVIPGLMNNFISTFKDTSLVAIVSLYELTGAMGMAMSADAEWRPFRLEGYLFIAFIYFAFCFAMSRYSQWVEAHVHSGKMA
jgi:general L-amino acid transport system permease protein